MEVIYSAQRDGFEAGKVYRNPRYFEKADPRVTKAIVCGDWPNVAAAYREAGAEVEVRPGPLKAGEMPPIPEGLKSTITIDGEAIVGGSISVSDGGTSAFVTDVTAASVEGAPDVALETTIGAELPVDEEQDSVTVIPNDWRDMHWKSRQKLAEEINPAFKPDPKNRVQSIDAVIEEALERLAEGAQ